MLMRANRKLLLKLVLTVSCVTIILRLIQPAHNQIRRTVLDRTLPLGLYQNHRFVLKTDYNSLKYHHYEKEVDLRIIVMTYNRSASLRLCLASLQGMITDGFSMSLDIWIDRQKGSDEVDADTVAVASAFRWTSGPVTVWIHGHHVGLFGQWIYTWRPQSTSNELALFVEDDVDVSPYTYRWLRAVHKTYGMRNDVSSYTVQDENALIARAEKYNYVEVPKPLKDSAYLYRLPGSWAMAPHPAQWRQFQDWFETAKLNTTFRPYVDEASIHTGWYKGFEAMNKQDSMWTMWFIHFMFHRNLFCVYSNLPVFSKQTDVSLSSNRKESGMHYAKQTGTFMPILLKYWDKKFINFTDTPKRFDFDGREI